MLDAGDRDHLQGCGRADLFGSDAGAYSPPPRIQRTLRRSKRLARRADSDLTQRACMEEHELVILHLAPDVSRDRAQRAPAASQSMGTRTFSGGIQRLGRATFARVAPRMTPTPPRQTVTREKPAQ